MSVDLNANLISNENLLATSTETFYTGDTSRLLSVLARKITILVKLYKEEKVKSYLQEAITMLETADALITNVVNSSNEEQSRLYWRKLASQIYMKGIVVCSLLDDKEKAFFFSEKKKAVLLIQDIIENTGKLQLPKAVLDKEKDLKKQLLEIDELLDNTSRSNTEDVQKLQQKRFKLRLEQELFEDSIVQQFPKLRTLTKTGHVTSLAEVQESMTDQEVIVSYIENEDPDEHLFNKVYAHLIFRNRSEIVDLGDRNTLKDCITTYKEFYLALLRPKKIK